MYKFKIATKKEWLILWNDKTGLAMMFLMPLILVYLMTIVQNSVFSIVDENKITFLLIDNDQKEESKKLVELIKEAKLFNIIQDNQISADAVSKTLFQKKYLTALYIPKGFSEQLAAKTKLLTSTMTQELGLEEKNTLDSIIDIPQPQFYHDPTLQKNYYSSILNMIEVYIKTMEGDLLIAKMCEKLDLKDTPKQLKKIMADNQVKISKATASLNNNKIIPNPTQHNVPAWTIFAMFFMVISLGNNIVKERTSGSFVRLKTIPTSFVLILGAKLFVYLMAAVFQVFFIFSLATLTFPSVGLPPLTMPNDLFALTIVVLLSGLAAVSYATAVGSVARTVEQANGFGAVSIVILAALGGVWVPSFILPDFLQQLAYFSPLHWCLECFYTLFLRGGNWLELFPNLLGLTLFTSCCFGISYYKLKTDKIIN